MVSARLCIYYKCYPMVGDAIGSRRVNVSIFPYTWGARMDNNVGSLRRRFNRKVYK